MATIWRYQSRHFRQFRIFTRSVQTQARYDYTPQEDQDDRSPYATPAGLATPRQVDIYLSYVKVCVVTTRMTL